MTLEDLWCSLSSKWIHGKSMKIHHIDPKKVHFWIIICLWKAITFPHQHAAAPDLGLHNEFSTIRLLRPVRDSAPGPLGSHGWFVDGPNRNEIDGPYLDGKKMGGSGPMANCFSCPKVARNDGEPVDLGLWHKNDPKCHEMVKVGGTPPGPVEHIRGGGHRHCVQVIHEPRWI